MGVFDRIIQKSVNKELASREVELKKQFDEAVDFAAKEMKLLSQFQDDPDLQGKWTTIGNNNSKPQSNEFLREYTEWVYANVSAIAEAVSHIELKLMRYNGDLDEVTEVYEHPVIELLNRPNPYMTKRDFIYIISALILLTGESPIRLRRKNDQATTPPFELWPLRPGDVTVKVGTAPDGFQMLAEYVYKHMQDGKMKEEKLDPWEVLMIKNPNPQNIWRGVGVVEAAARTIDILDYSETWNLQFFRNSAIPATVVYTEQKLNKEVLDRLKNSWNTEYRSSHNAYKTAILEQGLKIQQLQNSIKDMDFLEQQRFLRDKLMAMFKTTKVALGITEDVNRANAEASEYVFNKQTIKPKMQQIVDNLNEYLLPLFDSKGQLFFDFVDPLPEDRAAKVNEWAQLVDRVYTKNEIRREIGLPDIEGGDEIWQAVSIQPMGTKPTVSAPPINPQDGDNSVDNEEDTVKPDEEDAEKSLKVGPDGSVFRILKSTKKKHWNQRYGAEVVKLRNRHIELKRARREFRAALKQVLKLLEVKKTAPVPAQPKYKNFGTMETTQVFIKAFLAITDDSEAKIIKFLTEKVYKAQEDEIVARIKKRGQKFMLRGKKNVQKGAEEYMYNKDTYITLTLGELQKEIKQLLEAQGAEAMELLSSDKPYRLLNAATQYLKKDVLKSVKTFSDTTYTEVRDTLAEGLAAGEGEEALIKRLREKYSDLERSQAQRVARTETSRAANFANVDAYEQSGVVEAKQWAVVDTPCEFCIAQEGKVIGLKDSYYELGQTVDGVEGGKLPINYDTIKEPPLHVNCRCTTIPVLIGERGKVTESPLDKIGRLEKQMAELDESNEDEKARLLKAIEDELRQIKESNNG